MDTSLTRWLPREAAHDLAEAFDLFTPHNAPVDVEEAADLVSDLPARWWLRHNAAFPATARLNVDRSARLADVLSRSGDLLVRSCSSSKTEQLDAFRGLLSLGVSLIDLLWSQQTVWNDNGTWHGTDACPDASADVMVVQVPLASIGDLSNACPTCDISPKLPDDWHDDELPGSCPSLLWFNMAAAPIPADQLTVDVLDYRAALGDLARRQTPHPLTQIGDAMYRLVLQRIEDDIATLGAEKVRRTSIAAFDRSYIPDVEGFTDGDKLEWYAQIATRRDVAVPRDADNQPAWDIWNAWLTSRETEGRWDLVHVSPGLNSEHTLLSMTCPTPPQAPRTATDTEVDEVSRTLIGVPHGVRMHFGEGVTVNCLATVDGTSEDASDVLTVFLRMLYGVAIQQTRNVDAELRAAAATLNVPIVAHDVDVKLWEPPF